MTGEQTSSRPLAIEGPPKSLTGENDPCIDITVTGCVDARVRTTIDLPDDLHRMVKSIAADSRKSMSQTVADLIRLGVGPVPVPADVSSGAGFRVDSRTGLPLIRSPRPVNADDVRALEDD